MQFILKYEDLFVCVAACYKQPKSFQVCIVA